MSTSLRAVIPGHQDDARSRRCYATHRRVIAAVPVEQNTVELMVKEGLYGRIEAWSGGALRPLIRWVSSTGRVCHPCDIRGVTSVWRGDDHETPQHVWRTKSCPELLTVVVGQIHVRGDARGPVAEMATVEQK